VWLAAATRTVGGALEFKKVPRHSLERPSPCVAALQIEPAVVVRTNHNCTVVKHPWRRVGSVVRVGRFSATKNPWIGGVFGDVEKRPWPVRRAAVVALDILSSLGSGFPNASPE